ncbi:SagB/ThcOx family dehydrogenase [Thermodesulfobacteriota bacterium]
MPDLKQSQGYRYLRDTKFHRSDMIRRQEVRISPAGPFKQYPEAERVRLAQPFQPEDNFWELLAKRRSHRQYAPTPITIETLSLLLWAAQGVTASAGSHLFRTAPSAGALYPIETYIAAENIDDLPPGLFHFNIAEFLLERITSGNSGPLIAQAALSQGFLARSGVVFLWSAVLRRNMSKYKERGLRYICLDAGHICQNLLLAAEALGLKACPVAAFFDDELNDLLDLDGDEESILYLAAVGS